MSLDLDLRIDWRLFIDDPAIEGVSLATICSGAHDGRLGLLVDMPEDEVFIYMRRDEAIKLMVALSIALKDPPGTVYRSVRGALVIPQGVTQ